MLDATRSQPPKLLDEVRRVLRLHHYSIHTERSYVEWIVRFVRFHGMRSRDHLFPAEPKIEAFLTDLAVHRNVAAATQNQAMNALVFLYKRVLNQVMERRIDAVRADKKINVPVVMTREEVASVLSLMDGIPQLVAKLLYGSGLRIMEAIRLRIKDIDYQMKQLTVRAGKGDKDRYTTFPATLTPLLQNHLAGVKTRHQRDLAQGYGDVYLPHALARKSPHSSKAWGWQYVFPARNLSVDPRSGLTRRHHVDPSVHQQGHQGGGPPRRLDEAYQRPYLSSFLRHPPAATRHRHPHHSAPARAHGSCHYHDLYPHPTAGWTGRPKSLG
jgi:integron integrase